MLGYYDNRKILRDVIGVLFYLLVPQWGKQRED